jgi:hypothetical protein
LEQQAMKYIFFVIAGTLAVVWGMELIGWFFYWFCELFGDNLIIPFVAIPFALTGLINRAES